MGHPHDGRLGHPPKLCLDNAFTLIEGDTRLISGERIRESPCGVKGLLYIQHKNGAVGEI